MHLKNGTIEEINGKGGIAMTISVCMIVKNEEKLLRRCLDSLAGLYDELVIVDTGSIDNTKEIAWEYTRDVYDFKWVNDFAAARNFAFSKCTKEYIYSADADEVLDEANMEKFRVLKQYLDPEFEIVRMWYLTPLKQNEANGFEKEYRPKLFKRLRSWTWIDPVHESMRLEPTIYDSDISIRHLPATAHEGRDIAIYEKAVNRGGTLSPKLHQYYAEELYLRGSKDEILRAKEYFSTHVGPASLWAAKNDDSAEDAQSADFAMYRSSLCVLAKIARIEADHTKLYEIAMICMATFPCSEVCLEVGIDYYETGDYDNARNWLTLAMKQTSPAIDPEACGTKPEKYLELMNS